MKSEAATKGVVDKLRAEIDGREVVLPTLERMRQSGPFKSQKQFVNSSLRCFGELVRLTDITPDARVLDYGCGLGRLCIPLSEYLTDSGSYVGIDTDASCISYLQDLHSLPNFSFRHVDIFNKMYNRQGTQMSLLDGLDVGDPFDVTFLFSVFTHVLPNDMDPLLRFLKRTLKPEGQILASFFVLNETSRRGIAESTSHKQFASSHDGAFVDDPNVPEGAVAYDETDVARYVANAGLELTTFSQGNWSGQVDGWHWQDMVVLTHPRGA